MKKIFFILCLLPSLLWAAPVDLNLAQQVAENFINAPQKDANGVLHAPQKRKRMAKVAKQVTNDQQFYVFNGENGEGFVIVAADDVARPILGYSQIGSIDADNMPDNLRWWLSEYDREIRWAQENGIEQSAETAAEWQKIQTNQNLTAATPVVGPLILTKWDQLAPYNNLCPIYDGTNRSATGCVATATAQIMNYWQYPAQGTGSKSYTSATRGFQLSVNFSNSVYRWNSMLNEYSYRDNTGYHELTEPTTSQKSAVAKLMSDVGVACEMDYAANSDGESGSNINYALFGLINYFGYNPSAMPASKYTQNSAASWMMVLKKQLDENRPLLYQGGMHSFVCDGYNSDAAFHFNWGWSGKGDGWFWISNLRPDQEGTGAGDGDYTENQMAIVNLVPNTQTISTSNIQQFYLKLNKDTFSLGEAISYQFLILNTADQNFTGDFCVIISNGSEVIAQKEYKNITLKPANYLTHVLQNDLGNMDHFEIIDDLTIDAQQFQAGNYMLTAVYKDSSSEIYDHIIGTDICGPAYLYINDDFVLTPGKYVIVANRDKDGDRNWYYMTSDLGTASNKRFQAVSTGTESMDAISRSNLEDKYIWTLEADGSKWKLKNGNQYVTWTSGNSANLGSTAKSLTFEIADNQVQAHFTDGTNERYLALNATTGNNYFAFYSGTNQITYLFFLPYDDGTTPPPSRDCETVPFTESFASSQGDFTVWNKTLPSGFTSIWNWDAQYGMVAKCIKGSTKYASESYLISPCIEILETGKSVLTFSHAAKFFQNTSQMTLWISTNYDESDPNAATWLQLTIPNYPTGQNWNWFESGSIDLSAYKGQYVNIAFRYTSTISYAPQWEIKNFAVKKTTSTDVEDVTIDHPTVTKILRDGQILIIRGDKTYTLTGQEIR